MEILTLLKANIRQKKKVFFSIAILMLLCSMALTMVLSVKNTCRESVLSEMEYLDNPEVNLYIKSIDFKQEQVEAVKEHELVDRVEVRDCVAVDGATIHGDSTNNSWFLQSLDREYHLFNEDLSGYEKETPKLNSGEIYLTVGIKTNFPCEVGDKVSFETVFGDYSFTIKGFVAEPRNGASIIGWKNVFISDEDLEDFIAKAKETTNVEKNISAYFHIVDIFKSEKCTLDDGELIRKINLDTGISDSCVGSLTKASSVYYTCLFSDVIGSVLIVFICLLVVVVLIVMGNSISTGIEMEYTTLGVLKAIGFSKGKIQTIYGMLYLLAEIVGSVLGFFCAIPLIGVISSVFEPIMAIHIGSTVAVWESVLIILGILLVSALFIVLTTGKIGRVSPVRAICGGKEEVFFQSRLHSSIGKKGLMARLAFRQFTSNTKQYIGVIAISSLLMFFMVSIMVMGNALNSKTAMESMGEMYREVSLELVGNLTEEQYKSIEETVEEYSAIEKKYYNVSFYMSLEGEKIYCMIVKDPEYLTISKGRAPLYENEIVVTDILAKSLDLEIGDEVTVVYNEKKVTYMISGIYQFLNDAGMNFAMSLEGANRFGVKNVFWGGYSIEEPEAAEAIAKVLNEKYGDILTAEALMGSDIIDETYTMAVNAMKIVIYVFSVIFSLVVIAMLCSKMFLKERIDIGIYKAVGFSTRKLKLQFAFRFLLIAIIGSIIGTALSVAFSGKMLSAMLRIIGVCTFKVEFTLGAVLIPAALLLGCYFLFSYYNARKIKRVQVRELITE